MTFTEQTLDDTRLYVEEAMADQVAEARASFDWLTLREPPMQRRLG